jgi:hypothetical protein
VDNFFTPFFYRKNFFEFIHFSHDSPVFQFKVRKYGCSGKPLSSNFCNFPGDSASNPIPAGMIKRISGGGQFFFVDAKGKATYSRRAVKIGYSSIDNQLDIIMLQQ